MENVGVHFGVKGWSLEIDIDIFEEPQNHSLPRPQSLQKDEF